MNLLSGLLGASGGQNPISELLQGLLGGGAGGAQSNPLSALLGGGGQGDSISSAAGGASSLMNLVSLASMFA